MSMSVNVRVVDQADNPLPSADVTVWAQPRVSQAVDTPGRVVFNGRTDGDGWARFQADEGAQYTVQAQKPGYRAPNEDRSAASMPYKAAYGPVAPARLELVPDRKEVVYVNIEKDPGKGTEENATRVKRIAGIAASVVPGGTCVQVRYTDLASRYPELTNPKASTSGRPLALVLSGSYSWWSDYGSDDALTAVKDILKTTRVPILAFCGGHQLLAMAMTGLGAEAGDAKGVQGKPQPGGLAVAHVRAADGEYDKEYGTSRDVTLTAEGQKDPLFAALGLTFVFWHHDEVVKRGTRCIHLASTDFSTNQALRYTHNANGQEIKAYSTQFHPEADEEESSNGQKLIRNFLRIARKHWLETE